MLISKPHRKSKLQTLHLYARLYRVRAHNARRQLMHAIAISSQLCTPLQLNAITTIEEALAELDTLNSNEDIYYIEIIKKYNVGACFACHLKSLTKFKIIGV